MTFTVTYRGADGAVRTEAVEAASRAECFAQMKARGITPMNVKEGDPISRKGRRDGGNGSRVERADRVEGRLGSRHAKAVAAILVLAAITAGGALWWMRRDGGIAPRPEAPKKPSLAKEVKPAVAPKPAGTAKESSTNAPAAKADAPEPEMYLGKRVVSRQAVTNASGHSYTILRTEDGLTHRVNVVAPGKGRRLFKYSSDLLLAQALGTPGDGDMPPLMLDSDLDEQFARSLKEPVAFEDIDTEEERKLKETVMLAREDVKDLMKTGATFTEIMREHQSLAAENSEIRRKIALEAKKIRAEHGEDDAKEYLSKMNAALQRMGIAPLNRAVPNPRRRNDSNTEDLKKRKETEE